MPLDTDKRFLERLIVQNKYLILMQYFMQIEELKY